MKKAIRFTLESKQRPKLAQEIGMVFGVTPHYERVPSCAYDIAGYQLDKEGVLYIPEEADVVILINQLRKSGFKYDAELETAVPVKTDKLTIAMPKEEFTDMALENLQQIIANKQTLLQRVFRSLNVSVEIMKEKVSFSWFPFIEGADEVEAYTQFISRLCEMGRNTKRVSSKPTESDNDKYVFRCFLLRLGFIGKEYKNTRKILLWCATRQVDI